MNSPRFDLKYMGNAFRFEAKNLDKRRNTMEMLHWTPQSPRLYAIAIGCLLIAVLFPTSLLATSYYVNCTASSNGYGTQSSPWNNLASANAQTLLPGDMLLFNRGATCNGELIPKGSGSNSAVITIDAYGTGALPILDGGTATASTLLLSDIEFYDVKNLAVKGSSNTTVYVTGTVPNGTIHHIHLLNLDVSAVNHVAATRNDSGLIVAYPGGSNEIFDDLLIDGCTAHDTTAGEGISAGANVTSSTSPQLFATNVVVQNNVAHDVYGDGIVVLTLSNGVLQNNVAYNTGKCPSCTGSTPVGIWSWFSQGITTQNNESYLNHTWNNKDGGAFDIDYNNSNNVYQYNYGHDSDGYCLSVFGYGGKGSIGPTLNATVRYNICANNARKITAVGELYTFTWSRGKLDGVQMYNNTIYLNGVTGTTGIMDGASYTGTTPNFFKNNLVYSELSTVIAGSSSMLFNNNLYWNAAGTGYSFVYGGKTYTGFGAYQSGSGQDPRGINADPLLNSAGYHSPGRPTLTNGYYTLQTGSLARGAGTDVCAAVGACITGSMGTRDFFGQTLGTNHNIGAFD